MDTSISHEFKLTKDEILELLKIASNYKVTRIQEICSSLIGRISETEKAGELIAGIVPAERLEDDFVGGMLNVVGGRFEGNHYNSLQYNLNFG